jgi:hypothetical protein
MSQSMTDTLQQREADRAHWRKLLGKPEASESKVEPRKSLDQRIREWGEKCRADATAITTTVVTGEAVRQVGHFPSSFAVGSHRVAMDGTTWKRVS